MFDQVGRVRWSLCLYTRVLVTSYNSEIYEGITIWENVLVMCLPGVFSWFAEGGEGGEERQRQGQGRGGRVR